MNQKTVRLEDDTTGAICADNLIIGDEITIVLHDENGNEITKTGVLAEIFD